MPSRRLGSLSVFPLPSLTSVNPVTELGNDYPELRISSVREKKASELQHPGKLSAGEKKKAKIVV